MKKIAILLCVHFLGLSVSCSTKPLQTNEMGSGQLSNHETSLQYSQISSSADMTSSSFEDSEAEHDHIYSITNKKWYACGDSFTVQGYRSNDPGYGIDSVLQNGKYAGFNAVYPYYYIGNRTNCDVYNVAEGGMTIATHVGGTNCFTYNSLYQSLIPANADIVTLYFGINDSHKTIPIGTINDTTSETFYGAWNIVLSWLLYNRPHTRLGVIISNGCESSS